MAKGAQRLKLLVALLDALYDNYRDDVPYWARLPVRFVLKFADKTDPAKLARLKGATKADIETAISQSRLATENAALAAAIGTQSRELVEGLHKLCSAGLEGLKQDVRDAVFYSWITLAELREFRQEFRDRLGVSEDIVHQPPRNLPPRNRMFVGRQEELTELHRRLSGRSTVGVTQQTATHGHGGVGKSALALEYAWTHLHEHAGGAFWLKCDTDILTPQIVQLADRLHLSVPDGEPPEQTAGRVKERLEAGAPALLILDNVRGPEQWGQAECAEFLPGGNCRRLITTRSPRLGADLDMYYIERLPRDQGIELLARYRPDAAETANEPIVGDIVDWFDGLAVGLTVVGAYMKLHGDLGWEAYAASLEQKGLGTVRATEDVVQEQVGALPDRYDQRVDAVFDDAFAALPADQQRALEYAALLPEDNVLRLWLVWLLEHDETVELPERPGFEDRRSEPTINAVVELRLLHPVGDEADVLAVHRVLRRRLSELLEKGGTRREGLLDRIVELAEVRGKASHAAVTDKSLRPELTPLLALSGLLHECGRGKAAAGLANRVHLRLQHLGRFEDARRAIEWAIAIWESEFDPDHPMLATFCSNLASPLQDLGQFEGARRSMERAIAIDERNFEPDHPKLAIRYSNLATILKDLGQLEEARRNMERAIAIDEKNLEPDHPTLATWYSNLGAILTDLGQLEVARRNTRRAIEIWEKNLEPDHPTLVVSYTNLSAILKDLGQLNEARQYAERAITLAQANFEPDHPTLAVSHSNLAMVLHDLGRLEEARRSMERAIAIQEKNFEPDHPTLAVSHSNLAMILQDLGQLEEARRNMERAIAIDEKNFEPDHPLLATRYNNLAHIELAEGNRQAACRLWRRAYAILTKHFDAEHPHVRQVVEELRRYCGGVPGADDEPGAG